MAGVVRATSILDMTQRDVDLCVFPSFSFSSSFSRALLTRLLLCSTYDINVKAHYYTAQAFVPHMVEQGHGHVVVRRSSSSLSLSRTLTDSLLAFCRPDYRLVDRLPLGRYWRRLCVLVSLDLSSLETGADSLPLVVYLPRPQTARPRPLRSRSTRA